MEKQMADENNGKAKDLLDWLGVRDLPDFARARWIGAGVGVLLAGLFLLALGAAALVLFHTIGQAMNPDAEGPNLGAGALIAALLGAPFLIWGTWLKYQTVRYQKEGHITDRINKAVEMLGAEKTAKVRGTDAEETRPNIEVRIGAILSLERIAQDSTIHDKGRDHVRVMEILCAYVRENAPAKSGQDSLRQIWEREDALWGDDPARFEEWFCEKYGVSPPDIEDCVSIDASNAWAKTLPTPRVDIMQALQVIGRRTADQRRVEAAWPQPPRPDTIWSFDLPYPQLAEKHGPAGPSADEVVTLFKKRKNWIAQIKSYNGYQIDLQGTNLQGANLSPKRRDTSDAVFCGALFNDARMEGANLGLARLQGANFSNSWLAGADFEGARAEGAHWVDVQLEGACLGWARMEESYLASARMKGVYLVGARLGGANLFGAEMEGVNLRQTDVAWAAVKEIDLRNLSLAPEQIATLFGDASVSLPKDAGVPVHWPKWKLDVFGERGFDSEWDKWRSNPKGYVPPPPPTG
jgi:uncharacterized protein YjbI with pentapeptide repeats